MGRRMAGEKIVIKWINDKGFCKVAFMVEDDVYLLLRKYPLDVDKTIFGLECNKEHIMPSEVGREIWINLKKDFDFEEVKV
jgi:hypothetical protein